MIVTPEQACQIMSGRNTSFWSTIDPIASDYEWNEIVDNYNYLESQIDGGFITGIVPAPVRPRPTGRP